MKRGHWILAGAASAALLLAACSTSDTVHEGVAGGGVETNAGGSVAPPAPPPPPPRPSSVPSAEAVHDRVTVTGSRTEDFSSDKSIEAEPSGPATSVPAPDLPDVPQPEPQSGLLTAGDYDDVLNPALYQSYLDKALQEAGARGKDLPFVDAADRIAVRVTDRLGKPVPFADISLATANDEPMFPLRTGADGVVYIYPNYDALEAGATVSLVSPDGRTQTKTLTADDLVNGGELGFVLGIDAPKVKKLDLLLTLDATGSMADEMRYLQTELTSIMNRMERNNPALDIQAGLIVYRDKGDDYVIRDFDFTSDLDAFRAVLADQSADGGGDFPEAMHTALRRGLGLSWREDAIKVNLLVADAPPHDGDIVSSWESGLLSRTRGIHTVSLAASGIDPMAEFLMRGMSQITGGRYLFLTDDSGVGNPHAEPTVDCYIVTPLNGLVQRVLESLVTGTRVEPDGDKVIRTVGNYQAGVCKLDEVQ